MGYFFWWKIGTMHFKVFCSIVRCFYLCDFGLFLPLLLCIAIDDAHLLNWCVKIRIFYILLSPNFTPLKTVSFCSESLSKEYMMRLEDFTVSRLPGIGARFRSQWNSVAFEILNFSLIMKMKFNIENEIVRGIFASINTKCLFHSNPENCTK